ncbi:MAG: hypothetical protein K9J12_04625 [Melioribacteraceae bacterium]|nr:hypothetical protein [Melioribacteraceae bacterium]MCF8265034.1 hypothetical protein [Melioribacteraceae bacterium]MCF8431648.1 hypothetical protein [Melioribacteraceae bacterium]
MVGEFVGKLEEKLNPNTRLMYKIIPDGTHFLNHPIAMVFGLGWSFKND